MLRARKASQGTDQSSGAFAIAKSNRNTSKKILGTRKEPAEIYLCAIGPVAEENGMRIGIIGAGKVGGGLGNYGLEPAQRLQ
jgi:hypothetical protein